MNQSTTVREYFENEYQRCPTSRGFLESCQSMAITSHFLLVFCLPFHIFGGYCIIKKTPVAMKNMKWTLLNLQFWCSFFDISLNSLVTPYIFLPTVSGFSIGLFQLLGIPQTVQLAFGIVVFFGMVISISISFRDRAEVLPNNRFKISRNSSKVLFFSLNFLVFIVWTIFLFSLVPEQESAILAVLKRRPCPVPEFFKIPVFVLLSDKEYVAYMHIATGFLMLFYISENGFFICCCVYYLFFSVDVKLSKRTRELQLHCFMGILAQVSIPLIFLIPPVLVMWKSFMITGYSQSITNSGIIMACLHGFISTIVVILTHRPYRDYVLSFFTSKKRLTKIEEIQRHSSFEFSLWKHP